MWTAVRIVAAAVARLAQIRKERAAVPSVAQGEIYPPRSAGSASLKSLFQKSADEPAMVSAPEGRSSSSLADIRGGRTLPVKRVLRFQHSSARTTLRCDASNAGRSVSSFKQALHRGSGCAGELDPAAGLERWS